MRVVSAAERLRARAATRISHLTSRTRLTRALTLFARIAIPVALLVVLALRLGSAAFRPALEVIAPLPILAALLLGGIAVATQAIRWRLVIHGAGLPLGRKEALYECYRSSALNSVLPGGVGGDVLRAWRQRTGAPQGWRPGAISVIAERSAGLCVFLVAVAAVMVVRDELSIAAGAAVVALLAWMIARPSLRKLSRRQRTAVWGWSVIALAALLCLVGVAAVAIGSPETPDVIVILGLALLAGMAVPSNLGGWGPREAAGAVAAVLVGVPASVGVAVAAGYGILSTVSVLPGFLVLANRTQASANRSRPHEIELDAHVLTEGEAT